MRMKQRARRGYTLAELKEVWDRWKRQECAPTQANGRIIATAGRS